jgi:Undecaprenyl-phosphate galactose phosphotransferase WbaP
MSKLLIQRLSLVLSDIISMGLAFIAAIIVTKIYHGEVWHGAFSRFFPFGASKILGMLVICAFWYKEQYIKRRPFWEELLQIYRIILLFMIINLGVVLVMSKGSLKVLIVSFWIIFAVFLPFMRTLTKLILVYLGIWRRKLYIVGYNDTAMQAFKLFASNYLLGYQLSAFIRPDVQMHLPPQDLPAPLITIAEFKLILAQEQHCEVIIALNNQELNAQVGFISFLQHNCLSVLVLPEISGLALFGAEIEHFFGNDQLFLRLNNNLARNINAAIKRCFDLICTIGLLILLLPLMLLIAGLIKFSTGNKILYCHKRIGRYGKPFYCLKFQTMAPNSNQLLAQLLAADPAAVIEWEQTFKLRNDPRVTALGKWLRQLSLDELPQLFNVLKGEMSLVGPRPIVEAEIKRYADGFYYYQLVTPGITGLWQISGRNDVDYHDRIRLDEWYVKNWSLWYDIVILIKTTAAVVRRSGAY